MNRLLSAAIAVLVSRLVPLILAQRPRRRAEERLRIAEEFERSGLSRRQFCERDKLSLAVIRSWPRNST